MPARRWTTDEEHNFLEDKYRTYLKSQKTGTLRRFWVELNHDWFRLFSEHTKLFGDIEALTGQQEEQYAEAIRSRKMVSAEITYSILR